MTICSFCSLLCEFAEGDSIACPLREWHIAQLASTNRNTGAAIEGRPATIDEAIQRANRLLSESAQRTITGRIRSVEGARAALALAARIGAFVDPSQSHDAFKSIAAVQRCGMVTASMSEVRFRSDCLVLIGDDRLLDAFPRLANVLAHRTTDRRSMASPNIIAFGNWSAPSLRRLRSVANDVCSIDIDVARIPQSLFQWSRCNSLQPSTSLNLASRWMSNSKYLSLVWSPESLDMPHADLWIERLLQWIAQRNDTDRCVGFPLASPYVTFQQVCTWTTGFPGRVHITGESFRYDPNRDASSSESTDHDRAISLQIDESTQDASISLTTTGKSRLTSSTAGKIPSIVIAPHFDACATPPPVFIPCAIPGIDHRATFFRTDAIVAVEALDGVPSPKKCLTLSFGQSSHSIDQRFSANPQSVRHLFGQTLTVAEILARLGDSSVC